MSEPFVGQIDMFGGNFAPKGFALCNGQLLSIAQNQALFSLLGTAYGGDGRTTFALPNLQSRLPIHVGQSPGLSNYQLGQTSGSPTVTLNIGELPAHNHMLQATTDEANATTIGPTVLPGDPKAGSTPRFYAAQGSGAPLTSYTMDPRACSQTGGSQPHSNLMPSLCITFIIALQGLFPSRN